MLLEIYKCIFLSIMSSTSSMSSSPSSTPTASTTNYSFSLTNSQSVSISPIYQFTNSYSPTPSITVSSTPTNVIFPENISDDNFIIQKKYVGIFVGLAILIIFVLLGYTNYIYYKNKQLKKFIDCKKDNGQQQSIGRVSVKNILTSV